MSILPIGSLNFNKSLKINFDGGDLSSDAGLLLIKEFTDTLGIDKLLADNFKTTDTAIRQHTDTQNLMQVIYQIIAAYFEDDSADELTNDPVMKSIIDTPALASQPTLSRFYNRMDDETLKQFENLSTLLRDKIYDVKYPDMVLLDLDSTLLDTYGHQEGEGFNYHYQSHGYHPLLCFDGITGDLIKIQLRNGTDYSCTGIKDFLLPVLEEYLTRYPDVPLLLRGDSGFATPDLYSTCETNGTSYAIRLKENGILRKNADYLLEQLNEITSHNMVDYAVVYGEFYYQANSWDYPRRVVCKIEKPANQMIPMYTFVVTNMDSSPEKIIKFYCKRGLMENFIKEAKSGFDFAAVSSRSKVVNANRLQIHALAYNIFNWFRRIVLSIKLRKQRIDTIRLKLLKVAARAIHSARYMTFKLCSSCPYKDEFYETLHNIRQLKAQLE